MFSLYIFFGYLPNLLLQREFDGFLLPTNCQSILRITFAKV